MPTSATHITVLERVAASSSAMAALLGDPRAAPDTPDGLKSRFAKLGAVGPDIFYAMADYGGELQDLENFLIKVAGTFDCIGELMGKVGRIVDGVESTITGGVSTSLHQTFDLIRTALTEGLLAVIVGPARVNLWPVFESRRQKDLPREKWFWADYLHYIKTGDFVTKLIEKARTTGNVNLLAYAYGYLTHYVTDVVGHPYVNQVVQGPWRLYWQRHHLVENFVDAYVWDRWHVSNPPPAPPSTEEQPLDSLVVLPHATGGGAPVTFARLNDHINIGSVSLGDPVDALVQAVCDKIKQGLFDVGVAEDIDPPAPTDPDFQDWAILVRDTIAETYDKLDDHRTPANLSTPIVPGVPTRPNGYPTEDDVAAAYGVFRLVMRLGTEEKVREPQPPDIVGDISDAIDRLARDFENNLNSFPPLPNLNSAGSFSLDVLWEAIKDIAEWIGETMLAVGKAVFDLIADALIGVVTVVTEPIKFALFLLNKALFAVYSAFRDVLVYAGYTMPFTNRLSVDIGGGNSSAALWRSPGNQAETYPMEEIPEERTIIHSTYAPFVPPDLQPASQDGVGSVFVERPALAIAAPYAPLAGQTLSPDVFLDPADGPDEMFDFELGPQKGMPNPDGRSTIAIEPRDFGGAVANSIKGIIRAEAAALFGAAPLQLPNYNLDGDRSYAWPCWDVTNPEPENGGFPPSTMTPLRPEATNDNDDLSTHEAFVSVMPVLA
jgi:Zinc dependent phospholipase C